MKDVMIKFSEFEIVLDYIITRMRNHSMLVGTKFSNGLSKLIGVPQFKIFKQDLSFDKTKVELILNYLTDGKNDLEYENGIFYQETHDGWVVNLKTTLQADLLQNISENCKMLSSADQTNFTNILNKKRNMFSNSENDFAAKITKLNYIFPRIISNQDSYFEPSNKEIIDNIPKKPNNIPTIHSKDAIRNEYESHYTEHPVDYKNKEELESEIYNKLKPNYPMLSKTIIQKIGKEVRKEKNMHKQGRPKYRGSRGIITNK